MLLTTLAGHPRRTLFAMPLALTPVLTACGGGNDSDPGLVVPPPITPPITAPTISSTLTGTAATSAAIQGTVVAIDVNGPLSPRAVTNSTTGAYTVDVTGLTAPFLLTVNGSAVCRQVVLTSVATAAGVNAGSKLAWTACSTACLWRPTAMARPA